MKVYNDTNFPDAEALPIGTVVNRIDPVDPVYGTMCTIKYIEKDEELPNTFYYYLMANDETKNDKIDPRFPLPFFEIVPNTGLGFDFIVVAGPVME